MLGVRVTLGRTIVFLEFLNFVFHHFWAIWKILVDHDQHHQWHASLTNYWHSCVEMKFIAFSSYKLIHSEHLFCAPSVVNLELPISYPESIQFCVSPLLSNMKDSGRPWPESPMTCKSYKLLTFLWRNEIYRA